ncbi:MAG: hypothetical protein AUH15_03980 [Acidobacteriales bacterium 13_2_20CM_55_8]|nr:MAG: hypothetical protein AUH15_03980 [Acidobacteriales bacterium 13_2_20CM_55_8]
MKKLVKTKTKKLDGRKVKKLPSTAPAARDEGPRLLPLGEAPKEPSRLEHYLDLADAALGAKNKPGS